MKYWSESHTAIAQAVMQGKIENALKILHEHGYKIKKTDPCISTGNNKVGATINFSLPAVFGCTTECHKTCAKAFLENGDATECYAVKDYRYLNVVYARFLNMYYAMKEQETLKAYIIATIEKELKKRENKRSKNYKKPLFVRLHESGDFFNVSYLDLWLEIAKHFPQVTFYTYSKAFRVLEQRINSIPANLHILLSEWEGLTIPASVSESYNHATVSDKAVIGYIECPATGSKADTMTCEKCGYLCARLVNIRFNPH